MAGSKSMAHYHNQEIPDLRSALQLLSVDDLRNLALLVGEKPPTRKAELVDLIVRYLEGDGLRSVWQGLTEWQQAAVAEVLHGDSPVFNSTRFRAKYGRNPNDGAANASSLKFFFCGSVVPSDLRSRLKEFVPPPRPLQIEALDEVPHTWQFSDTESEPLTIHERERAAQRELLSVLRLVDAGKVMVSDKTRRPTATAIQAITAIFDAGDYYPHVPVEDNRDDENAGPIRAFAWPLLIQAGGLAQLSGTRLQLTKAGRKALSEPAEATIRALWKKWMDTTMLDELVRIDCVKGQTGKGKRGLTAASSRRAVIVESLVECPVERWIETDELLRFMQATGNGFVVSRHSWDLYIADPQYGSLGEGYGYLLDDRYVFALLLEYAATLGIIDVALIPPADARNDFRDMWGTDTLPFFSRYDGLMYFRITPLGAFCLGIQNSYQAAPPEEKPVLRILPDLVIEAAAGLEQSDRLALNAWTLPVSESVWRLETGKLLAAVEEGRQLDELRDFLKARSGAEIPDTVERLLAGVAERCTKFYDRGLARVIECIDADLAARIANDARIGKHCQLAGERHLVVPAASETAFRRDLRRAGYILASGSARKRTGEV
jgi:hypothetical protein